jgi:flagellar protein FlgJ
VTDAVSSSSSALASAATQGSAKPAGADDKLKNVAKKFEAVFMRQMIGTMRSASLGDGMFDSSATQQFRDMSDAKLADSMAEKGTLHVADLLVKQFGAKLSGGAAAGKGATTPATATAATRSASAKTTKDEPR